jgi:hypothetical protein
VTYTTRDYEDQKRWRTKHPEVWAANQQRSRLARALRRTTATNRTEYLKRRPGQLAQKQAAYAADPEPQRERKRAEYHLNLHRRMGLTEEAAAAMLAAQGGRCAICGTADPGTVRGTWCLDHDHATGLPRGFLCVFCNQGLGRFRDDPTLLAAAIAYLGQTRAP